MTVERGGPKPARLAVPSPRQTGAVSAWGVPNGCSGHQTGPRIATNRVPGASSGLLVECEGRKVMLYERTRPVHLGPVAGADEADVIAQELPQGAEV